LDVSKQKRVVLILAVVLSVISPAHAQTDELQKQLQQLKQQYEQTTRELQERITALELQLKKESEAGQNPQGKGGLCRQPRWPRKRP
jgi:type II secretory pathway pseudopilin PulG